MLVSDVAFQRAVKSPDGEGHVIGKDEAGLVVVQLTAPKEVKKRDGRSVLTKTQSYPVDSLEVE